MKTPAIEFCINNYINGNLTDAKKQAKCFSVRKLRDYMIEYYGWTDNKASYAALYLKGEASFQEAFNAE